MEPLFVIAAIVALAVLFLSGGRQRKPQRGRGKVRYSHRPRGGAPLQRYIGDFTGPVNVTYAPRLDGAPDPGEVVWTWVPFEEDHTQGKDRPVLLIGHDGPWLLGLQLSSQDRSHTAPRRPHHQPRWVDIGAGPWDAQRRPSSVRVDRIVRVDPAWVRREGAILDRKRFNTVTRSLGDPHH